MGALVTPREGFCYVDALRLARELGAGARLVHGWPKLRIAPFKRYGHAWVEVGECVFETQGKAAGIGSRRIYYDLGKIEERHVRRYTPAEAAKLLAEHDHYGPWGDDPYPDVCYGKVVTIARAEVNADAGTS